MVQKECVPQTMSSICPVRTAYRCCVEISYMMYNGVVLFYLHILLIYLFVQWWWKLSSVYATLSSTVRLLAECVGEWCDSRYLSTMAKRNLRMRLSGEVTSEGTIHYIFVEMVTCNIWPRHLQWQAINYADFADLATKAISVMTQYELGGPSPPPSPCLSAWRSDVDLWDGGKTRTDCYAQVLLVRFGSSLLCRSWSGAVGTHISV